MCDRGSCFQKYPMLNLRPDQEPGSLSLGDLDRYWLGDPATSQTPIVIDCKAPALDDLRRVYRELMMRDPLWPAVEIAAWLVTALQRDRASVGLAEDADRRLEELTHELGRLRVFEMLGIGEEPPADVRPGADGSEGAASGAPAGDC